MANAPKIFESAFNTYTATGVIGEGGSGRVFAVKDSDDEQFALKCLFPDRVNTEKRKRFKNEIGFCSRTQHANIIRVHDLGLVEWDKRKCPFYVMTHYPMTLRNLIDGKLAASKILPLFSQILDGVEAAHILRVIHRDLKPENILYDQKNERLVVADFGIAHFEEDIIATAVDTAATAKMANLGYSAPEQRAKAIPVDHRADLFALGLILNEMFTCSVPHGAGYLTIASVAPEFVYLDPLVEKLIQQDKTARFDSIDTFKKELIARKNEFVSLQELDKKRGEVVPVSTPPMFDNINLVGVDWQPVNNALSLKLDRTPESGWIQRFQKPNFGYSCPAGAAPHLFSFRLDIAIIAALERDVQAFTNQFKIYLKWANEGYPKDLEKLARNKEAERRQQLEKEVREAEARARVLANVKI